MSASPQASESSSTPNPPSQGERPSGGRIALFLFPAVLGLLADLGTKTYFFQKYQFAEQGPMLDPTWWIDGVFGVQLSTNRGALFGLGSGYSWLFAAFSVVAVVGILLWVARFGGWRDRWLTVCLGMITGGILGNLYDRIGLGWEPGVPELERYSVRDWIHFKWEGSYFFDPWPNFNIADSLLVCGAVMLMIHAIFLTPPQQDSAS